jgi:hypothetical protein
VRRVMALAAARGDPACRRCQAVVMNADVVFAGIPVSDFAAAQAWYERLVARAPTSWRTS